MIRNAREYQITKAQALKFERALSTPREPSAVEQLDPQIAQAMEDAARSQLEELREDLAQYEALQSGERKQLQLDSLREFPDALIAARIAAGLSQKELAERLGLKEQQVQRYEATGYTSASWSRVLEVAQVLEISVNQEIFLPSSEVSWNKLFSRLQTIGLNRKFVQGRLLPAELSETVSNKDSKVGPWKAARVISTFFGWAQSAIFSGDDLQLSPAFATARFKLPSNANLSNLEAYSAYAYRLASLTAEAVGHLPKGELPSSASEVRTAIENHYGELTLESALRYVWSLGVAVLPLDDPGMFHGAFWRISGRNVLVLKQRTGSEARWLIDLFHEFKHASEEPTEDHRGLVEPEDSSVMHKNSPAEAAATRFASAVVLQGREVELAKKIVIRAQRQPSRLKQATMDVATHERVPVDALANYLAYHLAATGENNWWATAMTLQRKDEHPWIVARDILLEHIDFNRLTSADRDVLARALEEEAP